ncbi:MAG: bifunctional folylpolyglutamate synthase/dihydrofolate synthase, partial [Thermomicrobiales bacterium]
MAFTYRDALAAIWERSSYDKGFIADPFAGDEVARLGLRRTELLLRELGDPQRGRRIVHVAGSKGKGSTCAFLSSMATRSGRRTGRFISPHLHSFRERVAVDGADLDHARFAALTALALEGCAAVERDHPEVRAVTAFELLTAMALRHFADEACDLAVIEVGLGGTLDATNVVDPAVSVIAALDYEHTQILGDTLAEIAANKAGIVKPGRPAVTAAQAPEAMAVIRRVAAESGSRLWIGGRDWTASGDWQDCSFDGPWGRFEHATLGLAGLHQVDNAGLALAALWLLAPNAGDWPEAAVREGLAQTRWPGRYEAVDSAAGRIVLDGAHTSASARALAATWAAVEGDARAVVILGVMAEKDPAAIARELLPIARRFIATASASPRAMPADALAARLSPLGLPIGRAPTVEGAIEGVGATAGSDRLLVPE